MQKELAELLVQIIENNGEEADLRDDYSGRGMYGDETYAVTCDCGLGYVLGLVLESVKDGYLTEDDLKDIKSFGFRQDSMGLGMVIY